MAERKRLYPTVREKIEVDIFSRNPHLSIEEIKKRADRELKRQLKVGGSRWQK